MRRRTLLRAIAVATMGMGVVTGSRGRGGQETTTGGDTPTTTAEGTTTGETTTTAAGDGQFTFSTPAFEDGGTFPTRFTCDGRNVSPPLRIANPPERTQSFALVMDDPDAPSPPFIHWLVWDIPADTREIPRNVPPGRRVESLGAVQGTNGAGDVGYAGPCPPEDDPRHTYLFSLFALDEPLGLEPGAEYREVLRALFPRAIERARFVGQYARGGG
ncbi:YbhB/YbcL family Raf kinase inhibitor-like protein [Halorussus halophilus]|uniref:YbhB/YbcL family Raf kinase inhibitor-like protein n=1 Tax=Halorussus halophilus TaxID=2650975 RepID=UPI00130159B9|nr:YbhB/YbcL family Raf kinase inhibitor-like protein [Halorussus halophilus]